MLIYRNTSGTKKTFYGVTFKPGDVKEVKGFINSPGFVRVPSKPKEPPMAPQTAATSKKEEKKAEKTEAAVTSTTPEQEVSN